MGLTLCFNIVVFGGGSGVFFFSHRGLQNPNGKAEVAS